MINSELLELSDNIPKNSILILHVGLKGIYDSSRDFSYQASNLLDEIRKTLSPKEIYIPTFTYNFTQAKLFNVLETTSEVGRFSEEIRKICKSDRNRYLDPVFSVVETELRRKTNNVVTDAFGTKSVWHYLDQIEHFILNINLPSQIISTQLHHLEYLYKVPYRYKKIFCGDLFDWDGARQSVQYQYFVRRLDKDYQWNRAKIANTALSHGALIDTGIIRAFDWRILRKTLTHELSNDLYYLVN